MTSDEQYDDDNLLAAEYALGLLTGSELSEARQRIQQDRDFALSVTGWEIQLAALTDDLEDEQPSAATKRALISHLFPEHQPVSFWQRARIWQMIAGASFAVLATVMLFSYSGSPEKFGPLYTAEIVADANDFRVVVVVDKTTNEVFLTKTAGAAPEGRILQVWAHGEDAPAISVGLWPEGDTIRLPMPPTIAAVEGILTVGVSEEPIGGSPTGSPSGRVFGTVDIPNV